MLTQKRLETSQGMKILASKQFENRTLWRKGEWIKKYKNIKILKKYIYICEESEFRIKYKNIKEGCESGEESILLSIKRYRKYQEYKNIKEGSECGEELPESILLSIGSNSILIWGKPPLKI